MILQYNAKAIAKSLFAGITLAVASTIVPAEQVYQWTDEAGVVHYSDKQPFDRNAKTLNVQTNTAKQATSSSANTEALYERAQKLEQKQSEAKVAAEQAKDDAEFKQANSTMCDTIADNLRKMAESSRIKVLDGADFRYLSPEEIAARKAEYQELSDKHCSAS